MDEQAYINCARELSDAVYVIACKKVKDKEEACDLVQLAFEALWKNLANVPKEMALPFLAQVIESRAKNAIKIAKRKVCDETGVENLANKKVHHGMKEALEIALQRLDPINRTLVILKDYDGLSFKQIAELTKMTEAQVKFRIVRARQTLKKFIGNIENVL